MAFLFDIPQIALTFAAHKKSNFFVIIRLVEP